MLQQLDNMIASSQDLRDKRTGVVRIGALPSIAAAFLPPRIAKFRKKPSRRSIPDKRYLGRQDRRDGKIGRGRVWDYRYSCGKQYRNRPRHAGADVALFFSERPSDRGRSHARCRGAGKARLILLIHGSAGAPEWSTVRLLARGRLAVAACEVCPYVHGGGHGAGRPGDRTSASRGVQLQIDTRLRVRPIEGPGFTRRIGIIRLKNKSLFPPPKRLSKHLPTARPILSAACAGPGAAKAPNPEVDRPGWQPLSAP